MNVMEFETMRERNNKRMKLGSILMGVIFGLLIMFVGIAIFDKNHFGIRKLIKVMGESDPFLMQLFGGICILYGGWRLFRSYNTYKELQ